LTRPPCRVKVRSSFNTPNRRGLAAIPVPRGKAGEGRVAMNRGDRSTIRAGLTAVLGLALLGLHVAYKRRPDAREVARFASGFGQTTRWQGRLAPNFEVELLDGTTFRLAEEVGRRVVILNFFTTWCGPCKAEMPELDRFARELAGRPAVLLAIDAQEKPAAVKAFLASIGVELRVAIDESGELLKEYGVDSFPTTVLIGPDGRIRLYQVGPILNADVAFGELMRTSFSELANGKGISREAYLAASPDEAAEASSKSAPAAAGRPKELARKMACPCGCDHTVYECACATAMGIKERLARDSLDTRSDDEIVSDLNREFCRKGT